MHKAFAILIFSIVSVVTVLAQTSSSTPQSSAPTTLNPVLRQVQCQYQATVHTRLLQQPSDRYHHHHRRPHDLHPVPDKAPIGVENFIGWQTE